MNARPQTTPKPSPVRALREQAGFTREQLAVRAGISSSTLYLVERAGLLTRATAEKLAQALGVPAERLQ